MDEKPLVRMCSMCQGIWEPASAKFATDVSNEVKNDMKVIDSQIRAHSNEFTFSHGVCGRHTFQSYQQIPGITPERLNSIKEKIKANKDMIPCLLEKQNQELRHAFMQGLFTPELIQKALQSNTNLTERFQKLAGI